MGPRPLGQPFFRAPTEDVARRLIGARLVHRSSAGTTVGRIVETEAYLSEDDPASHSRSGPTRRNASMFLPPGHAYVYLIYGLHLCFNVVTAPAGVGEAVLVRALEPLEGLELMAARRATTRERDLCSGPAKLVQAMGIGPEMDGVSLLEGDLLLCPAGRGWRAGPIDVGRRIGIRRAAHLPLRFCLSRSSWCSRS